MNPTYIFQNTLILFTILSLYHLTYTVEFVLHMLEHTKRIYFHNYRRLWCNPVLFFSWNLTRFSSSIFCSAYTSCFYYTQIMEPPWKAYNVLKKMDYPYEASKKVHYILVGLWFLFSVGSLYFVFLLTSHFSYEVMA